MTNRDRLIELICDKIQDGHCIGYCNHPPCTQCTDIADYLLANGVFILPEDLRGTEDFSISAFIEAMQMYKEKDRYIKPPCKVGDDIYWIDSDTNEIKCQKNGIKAVCYFGDDNFKIISKDENTPEDIGTRWCMFTKEEAEKMLERSK